MERAQQKALVSREELMSLLPAWVEMLSKSHLHWDFGCSFRCIRSYRLRLPEKEYLARRRNKWACQKRVSAGGYGPRTLEIMAPEEPPS